MVRSAYRSSLRILISAFLLLLCPAFAQAQWTYYRSLTISNTQATGTNENFPMLFVGGSYLKTVGNGGRLQNSSGYDHIYSLSTSCTSPLNYETEPSSYVGYPTNAVPCDMYPTPRPGADFTHIEMTTPVIYIGTDS